MKSSFCDCFIDGVLRTPVPSSTYSFDCESGISRYGNVQIASEDAYGGRRNLPMEIVLRQGLELVQAKVPSPEEQLILEKNRKNMQTLLSNILARFVVGNGIPTISRKWQADSPYTNCRLSINYNEEVAIGFERIDMYLRREEELSSLRVKAIEFLELLDQTID